MSSTLEPLRCFASRIAPLAASSMNASMYSDTIYSVSHDTAVRMWTNLIDAHFNFQSRSFFPYILSEFTFTSRRFSLNRDWRRSWWTLPLWWLIQVEWSVWDTPSTTCRIGVGGGSSSMWVGSLVRSDRRTNWRWLRSRWSDWIDLRLILGLRLSLVLRLRLRLRLWLRIGCGGVLG